MKKATVKGFKYLVHKRDCKKLLGELGRENWLLEREMKHLRKTIIELSDQLTKAGL